VVAGLVSAVPFLWILWGPWQSPSPLRKTVYEDNFYDLQARAMFHGHFWLPKGAIGIEAFIHAGRQYTYFGLFPSILRMPVLAVTSRLDGRLTASSMLLAWVVTAVLLAMLVWRVRVFVRGDALLSRAEALSLGLFQVAVLAGTVLLFLASTPFVFNEDISWSICLTIGSLFALLGLVERPTWSRVLLAGAFILAGNLDRATTGWACALGAVLVAAWLWLGRGGNENRRWWLPVLGAGLVPLVAGFAVNWAKFGVPIGVSNFDQVWTQVNAYRRQFLASNHNSEWGPHFIPSTALAYLRPNGLRLTAAFPFVTLPSAPAHAVGAILFDRRYRTPSATASMPLLTILGMWGLVAAFRRRPPGRANLMRLPMAAGIIAVLPLALWGYIAPRYLGDFVPVLALAGALGLIDIWRRLDGTGKRTRWGACAAIAALVCFEVAANIGMSITPNEEWSPARVERYVQVQRSVGGVTGNALAGYVHRGSALPTWAPADELYVVGNCDGLYISNGEDYSSVPANQLNRTTWMTVALGPGFDHQFQVHVVNPVAGRAVTLVRAADSGVSVQATPWSPGVAITVVLQGPDHAPMTVVLPEALGSSHVVDVVTDAAKHLIVVSVDGVGYLSSSPRAITPIVSGSPSDALPAPSGGITVTDRTASAQKPTLCGQLTR
jgi:hypothetical protein